MKLNPDLKAVLQCVGKAALTSATLAQQVAKRQNQTRSKERMVPYHCKHCGQWHTGSSRKPKKPIELR